MTFSLAEQTLVFLQAILLGVAGGVVYDGCRALRRTFGLKLVGTAILDGVFWLFVLSALFYFAVTDAASLMRFYVILGEAGGMVLYFLSFSGWILTAFCLVLGGVVALVSFIQRILLWIAQKTKILKKLGKICIGFLKKIKKKLSFSRKLR